MLKRLTFTLIPLMSLAVQCNPSLGDPQWGEFRVDGLDQNAQDLIDSHSSRMCVTPNGTVYELWIDDRDVNQTGLPNIWMNRKLPGGEVHEGWLQSSIRVNQNPDSNVFAPQLGCNDQQVHVVWEDDRDGEVESHQIYYQRSNDLGETWLPEDVLIEEDEDGRTNSFSPQIVVRANMIYVTWYDDLNGAYDILVARSPDSGNTWERAVRVDSSSPAGSAWSAHPKITASDDGGRVYVAWQDFRGAVSNPQGGSDIWFARSSDRGINFDTDRRLDGGTAGAASAFAPRIATGPGAQGDEIYVVWHDDRNGENDVFMAHSANNGVNWTPDTRADQTSQPGFFDSLYPKVCVSNGSAHVVWHDQQEGAFHRVFYMNAVAGAWTGAERRIDAYKPDGENGIWRFDGGAGSVQLDCQGDTVLAAWLDSAADPGNLGFNDIVYNFSVDNGANWFLSTETDGSTARQNWDQAPYRLDSNELGTAFKTDLSIKIVSPEEIRAAWTDNRLTSTDVFYQQLVPGEEPTPVIFTER